MPVVGKSSRRPRAAGEAITTVDEPVFELLFGMDWRTGRVKHMDFSSREYNLESITAGPANGLLHKELKRHAFTFIDLSNNNLSDIDCVDEREGFTSVVILKAKHNSIIELAPNLHNLKELNLAYNELTALPKLAGAPHLEILVLSHNRISGNFDQCFKCRQMKRLDLSANEYELNPTQLQKTIFGLAQLGNLTELKVCGNAFCDLFPEYQTYFLKGITTLVKLDDVKITVLGFGEGWFLFQNRWVSQIGKNVDDW